jgi:tRNA-specific adenosine deaminase 3
MYHTAGLKGSKGSLFNHSDTPNVSYTPDKTTDSIRYVTVRDVQPEEELNIFYGHNLWFSPAGVLENEVVEGVIDDGWGGLLGVVEESNTRPSSDPLQNPGEPVKEEDLPFTRYKLPPEEEEPGSIRTSSLDTSDLRSTRSSFFFRTVQTWVTDILDQKHIATLLK